MYCLSSLAWLDEAPVRTPTPVLVRILHTGNRRGELVISLTSPKPGDRLPFCQRDTLRCLSREIIPPSFVTSKDKNLEGNPLTGCYPQGLSKEIYWGIRTRLMTGVLIAMPEKTQAIMTKNLMVLLYKKEHLSRQGLMPLLG
jgi:hypothetical protein